MGLIASAVVQTHLETARHLELSRAKAVIGQRQRAYLGIQLRDDTDGTAGLDVPMPPAEVGAVGLKIEYSFVRGFSQRFYPHRPDPAVAQVTDVMELAPAVARGVLPPAGHVEVTPRAVAGPRVRDHHVVRAVREQRQSGWTSHDFVHSCRQRVSVRHRVEAREEDGPAGGPRFL